MLGHVRAIARSGACSVLLITHKFREVEAYADAVTVLRRGRAVHHGRVAATAPAQLAAAMMGQGADGDMAPVTPDAVAPARRPTSADAPVALAIDRLQAMGDRGTLAVHDLSLAVRAGEILGVAGVSGNGQ